MLVRCVIDLSLIRVYKTFVFFSFLTLRSVNKINVSYNLTKIAFHNE